MPQKVGELAKTLPYYPKKLPLVLVSVKGKGGTFKDVTVRRAQVEEALYWLIENNPHYKDLKINMHALSSLSERGIPNDLKVIESVNDDVGSDDDIGEDSSIDYEEIVYNESTETSSIIPDIGNDQLECEAIRTALLNNKIDRPELE